MHGLAIYWHTLRHLKPVQIIGRVRFRLARPQPDLADRPEFRARSGSWVPPARRHRSLYGETRFHLLNETRDLGEGWDDPAVDKLWRYNLHYFDDLNASAAEERAEWHRALLLRWVRENPPAIGTAWEPYPTSLRVVNWIKWALLGNALPPECEHSLAIQARWLANRVESHLLGNHLLANAKALVFAGMFFEGAEAQAWLAQGAAILDREIPEQVLPDGGHLERSPMYQALVLEDMLDLTNLLAAFARAVPTELSSAAREWQSRIDPMRRWLSAMCHPDGDIAFFNDAALGISPTLAELEAYASRLGMRESPGAPGRVTLLSPSGYVRLENTVAVVILDVAPVAAYLPAHAHADTLSFELSVFGSRVVVNSGTSCYGASGERVRQRGTAAHNTVVVNGENSSEVWGGFRVGRRANPFGLTVLDGDAAVVVRCSHDGYRRLSGDLVHFREWSLGSSELVITDRVSGAFARAEARFHLHPSISVESALDGPPRELMLRLPGGVRARLTVDGGIIRKKETTWHPEFGVRKPNVCIVAEFVGDRLITRIRWADSQPRSD